MIRINWNVFLWLNVDGDQIIKDSSGGNNKQFFIIIVAIVVNNIVLVVQFLVILVSLWQDCFIVKFIIDFRVVFNNFKIIIRQEVRVSIVMAIVFKCNREVVVMIVIFVKVWI